MLRELACGVLLCLTLAGCGSSPVAPDSPDDAAPAGAQGCARNSVGVTPLTDLVGRAYEGEPGGLYRGSNAMPAGHQANGLTLAQSVGPLDANGASSQGGRYAFVSIGMSNTTQEFSTFVQMANADPQKDPALVIVDGAQGGQTAADWANPACGCWTTLDARLRQAGLSNLQVATAWVKLAERQPSEGWPTHARRLADNTAVVLQRLRARFPNLRLAYLSSRIYAGYATTTLNPEPYAYQSGFSMRWVIEDQVAGSASLRYDGAAPSAPWVAWGPYLWADGVRPRSDGLSWACSDLEADGTHPSDAGQRKVAQQLLNFVRTDSTAQTWFLR